MAIFKALEMNRPLVRAPVLDLKGHWLLPGFVDAHVHVADLAAARRVLRSGATTIGEAEVNHFADVGMRELNHKGVVDVPDVVAAGYHIRSHPADDYFVDFPQDADLMGGVHGVENVRRMVREMATHGVNRIKVMATERAGTSETDPRIRIFNGEELAAIVDEANKAGLWVVAHTHGDEGAAAAVRAGVHVPERRRHFAADETERRVSRPHLNRDRGPDRSRRRIRQSHPTVARSGHAAVWREMTAKAWKMGIKIVAGKDTSYFDKNNRTMTDEIIELTGVGIPPMDAIKAGTSLSAEELGVTSGQAQSASDTKRISWL